MKYYINPSCSMGRFDDENVLVVCNDYLRKYECDAVILENIIAIVRETGSIDEIYQFYKGEYTKDEIDEFLGTLIQEEIIKTVKQERKAGRFAVLGEKENYLFLKNVLLEEQETVYFENIEEYAQTDADFTGVIWLPGELKYQQAIEINKKLFEKEIPYILCRYNGESFVLGPYVFPWRTPCVECHIQQHIHLLNHDLEEKISADNLKEHFWARKWDDTFSDAEKRNILEILLEDAVNASKEKTNFNLYKKEVVIPRGKIYHPLVKNYQAISECTCCRSMNKNYRFFKGKIDVPELSNPLDGTEIKYHVGGLRSKTPEETEKLVQETLNKMELDIKIEVDTQNPFSHIIPVYHSTLEMTHKNKTSYFFGEQHSHGKGINKRQAYFSTAFEMFERLSARYFGEKEIICGSYDEMREYCADISGMTQIVPNVNTVYDQFMPDRKIDWVWGYSLVDNKPKLLPASLVFLSRNTFQGNFAPIGSSGMSAGATIKDAILQGMFELLEHDAWMIGQANIVRLPIVEYEGLKNRDLKEVIEKIKAEGFEIISRDYTNDIGIPVIRTWISNPKDYASYAFSGFGASIHPELALERSITEAVQSRATVHEADVDDYASLDMEYLITARDGLYSLFYFQQKDIVPIGDRKDISDIKAMNFSSVDESLKYVMDKVKAVQPDADILYVDLTRPGIGIPVVKIFITKGTQLMGEPLLVTSERIYSFQKTMGYSENTAKYTELYLAPYPH